MVVTVPLALGLAMLLGWNLHLALANKTTIEHHEGVTARIQARPWAHVRVSMYQAV